MSSSFRKVSRSAGYCKVCYLRLETCIILHSFINLYFVSLSDALHIDKQNADAIYIRGMCLYFQDDIDRAFAHFQQVLRLAPDHAKALEIYKVGITDAIKIFTNIY